MKNDEITVYDTEEQSVDTLTGYVKGGIGAIPIAGPILAEMIGSLIPGQRMDRISDFLKVLDRKLGEMGEDINTLKSKMTDEGFLDLFSEASWQSTKATSNERKEYLASILINGLDDDNLDEIQKNIFLNIMNELNDIEVLILYSHTDEARYDDEFNKKHEELLMSHTEELGLSSELIDQSILFDTYRDKLVRFNLLQRNFKKPRKGELPEFDEETGMIKAIGHTITPLGRLLLRYIDLLEKDNI